MERFCVQPVKVPFSSVVYRGSELIMNLPKLADAIGAIRLVLDEPTEFLEEIIQEAEIIGIEKLWGEFIRIENDLKLSIEKSQYRSSRIISIPFHCFTDFYFDPITLRLLFLGGGEELNGHLLIDYVTTGGIPKTPYFKKTRHVSMIKAPMNNSTRLILDVYIPGSVYELFFTVRDTQGNFVQCIENVTLLIDDRERFNCTGDHLHYIEPLKRYGSYAPNVYMYSFSLMSDELRVPAGQTCLSDKQRFIIDTWPQTGTLTIWACSHNFVYNNKQVFDSYELALHCAQDTGTVLPVPVRTSSVMADGTLTILYTSSVPLKTPQDQYQILNGSGSLTFSSPGYNDTVCVYNSRDDWLGPPQLYDMFYVGQPYILIDGNNRLFLLSYPFCTDQYATFFALQVDELFKFKYDGSLVYTVTGVSCLPGVYFGFEAIALLSGGVQTTNGTIATSFAADSIAVDSSNVYIAYQNTYYVYDQTLLTLLDSTTVSPTCTSPSLIGLTRTGPVLCLSTGDVYQFGKNTWHVTTSPGGTLKHLFISEYDDVFISYTSGTDFYLYKVGTPYFKHYYGADAYDVSFSGSMFIVSFSAVTSLVTVTEQVTHEYGKTIPQGTTCFIQLNINLQYNSNEVIVHYTTPFNVYENPKYDATYFSASIIGEEIPFVNSYLWNNFVVCNVSLGATFSLSCDTSGGNVYSALNTDSTASSIYGTHGVSSVSVPATTGFSATLVSMNTLTSTINWVAVIDGMGSTNTQSTVASSSNVYMCGSYGPQSSNVYNSNNTVATVLPSGSQRGSYLVKYSSSGTVRWASYCSAQNSPITMSSISTLNGVTTCFVSNETPSMSGTVTIHDASFASSCVFTVYSNFGSLVQYGSTGNYIRSIYFTSQWISTGQVLSVNSNVYCSFSKGPGGLTIDSGTTLPGSSGGQYNSHCIVKFNSILASYYGMMISSANLLYVGCISVDPSENVYATGFWETYGNRVSVYDSSGTNQLVLPTNNSSYIMKFDSSGKYVWTALFYSTSGSESTNFSRVVSSVDGTSIFVTGSYNGSGGTSYIRNADYSNGIPIIVTPTSSTRDAIFIKLTADTGISQWYVTVTGLGDDSGVSITTDVQGYVYFSGYYTGDGVVIRDGLGSVYNTYNPVSPATQVAFHIKVSGLNGSLVTVT